jgi:lysophospholipase L1-like esterase
MSIPDWSVTPFIEQDKQKRTAQEVSLQITQFNQVIEETAKELNVAFVNITPISQRAKAERNLIAQDGLHPSGEMYALWAKDLAAAIAQKINSINNEF